MSGVITDGLTKSCLHKKKLFKIWQKNKEDLKETTDDLKKVKETDIKVITYFYKLQLKNYKCYGK